MDFLWMIILLVVGFVLLIKGADFFVEGSAAVAKKLKVPTLIIGMTIVAMGTSAPECAVSISAALKDANTLAVSNVVGSNLFNLLVVCGLCALMLPLMVDASTIKKEFPFSIIVGLLMMGLAAIGMELNRLDGIILLVIFILFLVSMIRSALKAKREGAEVEEEEIKDISGLRCVFYIVFGIAAIVLGGDMVVDGASGIAASFGLSQTLIGLTIVAVGTSLPELVTSLVAAKKNEMDMAVGNVIGSNIFNVLLIIGLAATVSPISIGMENIIDLGILAVLSFITYLFCLKDKKITKWQGVIMLILYTGFITYTCVR